MHRSLSRAGRPSLTWHGRPARAPYIHWRSLSLLCIALLLSSCTNHKTTSPSNHQSQTQPAFRPLFNGKDLTGFTTIGSALWKIEDGIIHGGQHGDPKRSGVLTTTDQFQDFELKLDFLISEHGKYNSGVYLRNIPGRGGRTGYQINIGRAAAQEYTGGIYTNQWLAKGDEHDKYRNINDWNTLHIRAHGPHIVVHLNGQKVSDFTDPNPPPDYLKPGVIAFQTYGAEGHAGFIKLRNLHIRELK